MNRVTVMGSINMDLVVRVRALPGPGETVLGDRLLTVDGGKGANQAVAAARLGAEVRFIGRVGTDAFGEQLLRGLDADRVDRSGVTRDPDEPSGAALIVVEEGGQNTVTVAPRGQPVRGRNRGRVPGRRGQSGRRRGAAAGGAPGCGARGGGCRSRRRNAGGLERGAGGGADRAGTPGGGSPGGQEAEAAALSGQLVDDSHTAELAAAWLGRSARAVAVTRGKSGSVLWESGRAVHVPPRVVHALDATAAGDAFVGAAAFALAAGRSVAAAIELGSAAGAIAATRVGARSSLPTAIEVLP